MTERTVTVQTEQEETIAVCNHCSVADTEDNVIEYGPWDRQDQDEYEHVHFHRECLEELGMNVPDAPTFEDTTLKNNRDLKGPVVALPLVGLGMVGASYLFIAAGAAANDLVMIGAGGLLILFNLVVGRMQATKTIEEMEQ